MVTCGVVLTAYVVAHNAVLPNVLSGYLQAYLRAHQEDLLSL